MGSEPTRLTADERTKLVAYLDGELDEGEAKAVASKLAQSAEVRREAEVLRATWGLLDMLPRARASEDFGSKTLTAVSRLDFPTVPEATAPPGGGGGRAAPLAACLAATVLAAGLGFLATRWARPDPGARLLRQFSLAEHLDEYRTAGSLEFLQRLDESDAFDDAE